MNSRTPIDPGTRLRTAEAAALSWWGRQSAQTTGTGDLRPRRFQHGRRPARDTCAAQQFRNVLALDPLAVAFVDPGRGRGAADRLGVAVALCTLPWLGFVPDKVASAPAVVVARRAEQLKVDAAQLRSYGKRAQTRTEHLRLVAQYLGWRSAGAMEFKELDEFLLARAMEHDSPTLLFRPACEYLISARVIRPGPVTVVERVAHARQQARQETYGRLAHEPTPERCAQRLNKTTT